MNNNKVQLVVKMLMYQFWLDGKKKVLILLRRKK